MFRTDINHYLSLPKVLETKLCYSLTVIWPYPNNSRFTGWRHQMEAFSALLALCVGNSPVTDEFSSQRPVTRSFDVFFDMCLNKRLSKQSRGWWFETPSGGGWVGWGRGWGWGWGWGWGGGGGRRGAMDIYWACDYLSIPGLKLNPW